MVHIFTNNIYFIQLLDQIRYNREIILITSLVI